MNDDNHAIRAWPCGRMLLLSGQVGWTADERFVSKEILGQFSQALANLQSAMKAGGGRMDDIVQMRIYVTDMAAYKKQLKDLGKVWRQFFGGVSITPVRLSRRSMRNCWPYRACPAGATGNSSMRWSVRSMMAHPSSRWLESQAHDTSTMPMPA